MDVNKCLVLHDQRSKPPKYSTIIQEQEKEEKKHILNNLRIWLTDYQNS